MDFIAWLTLIFPVCMLVAMYTDFSRFEIPNLLCLVLAISFLPIAIFAELSLLHILGRYGVGMVLFMIGMVLFHFNYFGGGDGKLIAAVGIWTGHYLLPAFLLYMGVFGGVLALIIVLLRKSSLPDKVSDGSIFKPILSRDNGIPYGIAIGIAGLIIYPFLPFIRLPF